jgi:hypothetical protein
MKTWKTLLPALVVAMAACLLPTAASAQNPANCNANLFDQAIARDKIAARPGETVTYTVAFVNRTTLGSPPTQQIGCNVLDVTANFNCPGPTGAPNGPGTNLVTNVDFPADGNVITFPSIQCVMPDIDPGVAFAGVFGTGLLDDGGPSPFLINKTISVAVQSCLVTVDKQVSCDNGVTWVDPGQVFANEDGTHGCNALDGTPILVRYNVANPGQTSLFSCTLTDSNPAINGVTLPAVIARNTSTGFLVSPNPPACSSAFEANEPNTATVSCFCTESLNPDDKISAFDVATVACQSTPDLNVSKACEAGATPGAPDDVTIQVSATTADLSFVNCVLSDNIFLESHTCVPPLIGTGTAVLNPAPFSLTAGQTLTFNTTVGPLSDNACNVVEVTCTIAGTALQRSARATAVCPGQGEGCLTRTPGFWGTHPAITQSFLPLEVCGVTINNTTAGNGTSAIEAMCSVGTDGKILGPQNTQLVRQCMAATLNVAASTRGGGNCEGDNPSLTPLLAACCGADSVCDGHAVPGFDVGFCIAQLDAFNNSLDTLPPFGQFRRPGPADSSVCRASKGNGVVVHPQ